jgi:hypothetical protein
MNFDELIKYVIWIIFFALILIGLRALLKKLEIL